MALALFATSALCAQTTKNNSNNLALAVLIDDSGEDFPSVAKQQIENRLFRLLTQNGVATTDYFSQFFITVKATPLTKDVVAGPPMKLVETIEMDFYIADYYNQLIYSTTSVTCKAVGNSDAKCYLDGLRTIDLTSPEMQKFVTDGKSKIIEYYNTQADKMMEKAVYLASQKKYDEALWIISTIPAECDKSEQALRLGTEIFQQYTDYQCQVNLAKAKAEWASQQNADGAFLAGEYLSNIYPDAACYGAAEKLYAEIKGKVLDDWKFEMKKWQDGVDVESQRINAWREVGVAYGRGQQPSTTNITWLR